MEEEKRFHKLALEQAREHEIFIRAVIKIQTNWRGRFHRLGSVAEMLRLKEEKKLMWEQRKKDRKKVRT